jgi:hypothetical protein
MVKLVVSIQLTSGATSPEEMKREISVVMRTWKKDNTSDATLSWGEIRDNQLHVVIESKSLKDDKDSLNDVGAKITGILKQEKERGERYRIASIARHTPSTIPKQPSATKSDAAASAPSDLPKTALTVSGAAPSMRDFVAPTAVDSAFPKTESKQKQEAISASKNLGTVSSRPIQGSVLTLIIAIDEKLMVTDFAYKAFVERVRGVMGNTYRRDFRFLEKVKVIAREGIALMICRLNEEDRHDEHRTCCTDAIFFPDENVIKIFSKNNVNKSDAEISILLRHEVEHAFKYVIHEKRWRGEARQEKNDILEKNGHALPFYPYEQKEMEKYHVFINQGEKRFVDFHNLLHKWREQHEKLTKEEAIRLEGYKSLARNHVPQRISYLEGVHEKSFLNEGSSLLKKETQRFINSGMARFQVAFRLLYGQTMISIPFWLDKIVEYGQLYSVSGYFCLNSNEPGYMGRELEACRALIGECLVRRRQVGVKDFLAEYHAYTVSALTEDEVRFFYPELFEYDQNDGQLHVLPGKEDSKSVPAARVAPATVANTPANPPTAKTSTNTAKFEKIWEGVRASYPALSFFEFRDLPSLAVSCKEYNALARDAIREVKERSRAPTASR